jgi:hypothetical protein
MGEFSIVLNVIQMNMIADGLGGTDAAKKDTAIKQLTQKNAAVKGSSEFMKMRIGILLHDILKLRVDIGYCSRTGRFTATTGDLICLEYVEIDSNGSRITTYRRKLHDLINRLCDRLLSDDAYDTTLREKIMDEVVKPYLNLLEKSKFSDDVNNDNATQYATLQKSFTLDPAALQGLNADKSKRDQINTKMDAKIAVISEKMNQSKKPMRGGFSWPWSKPNPQSQSDSPTKPLFSSPPSSSVQPRAVQSPAPTAAKPLFGKDDKKKDNTMRLENMIAFLTVEPYMLISDDALTEFLSTVYNFSKKESKTTQKEVAQAAVEARAVVHTAPPPTDGQAAVSPADQAAVSPADQAAVSPADQAAVSPATGPPAADTPAGGARYRYSRKRIRKSKPATHTFNRKHKHKYKTSKYRRHY